MKQHNNTTTTEEDEDHPLAILTVLRLVPWKDPGSQGRHFHDSA
jgi:hypothetical protein